MPITATLPANEIARASELRATYPWLSAATRLSWARDETRRSAEWSDLEFDSNMTARITRDGFSVHVQYTYDEYPDVSFLGEYTDNWQPGAIKHLGGWHTSYDGTPYGAPDAHTYGWFIPANSAEEVRQWYRKAGHGRHDAWLAGQRQARKDYERRDDITVYVLKVTAYRAGVELGFDCVGGIDLGDDLPNIDANEQAAIMAIDSINSAIAEAKAAMKTIATEFVADATID